MSEIIFSRPEDSGVSVVYASGGNCTDSLAAKTVPPGVEYQIIDSKIYYPVDTLFRNAWTWEGHNKPIREDLDQSKKIAIEAVKQTTRDAVKKAADDKFFDEAAVFDEDAIKQACKDCMAEIEATDDPYAAKLLMCAFCGLPEPELPLDDRLKSAAEEAAKKIKNKLTEIAEAIKAFPTIETMPAPIA